MEIKVTLRQLLESGHLEFLTKNDREFFEPKNELHFEKNLNVMIAKFKGTFLYLPLVLIREGRFKVKIASDTCLITPNEGLKRDGVWFEIRLTKFCQALCALTEHIARIQNALTYHEPVGMTDKSHLDMKEINKVLSRETIDMIT